VGVVVPLVALPAVAEVAEVSVLPALPAVVRLLPCPAGAVVTALPVEVELAPNEALQPATRILRVATTTRAIAIDDRE
jgi:hypothetical protein